MINHKLHDFLPKILRQSTLKLLEIKAEYVFWIKVNIDIKNNFSAPAATGREVSLYKNIHYVLGTIV